MIASAAALVRRDVRLALRQGNSIGTALGFFLTILLLLPVGLGPDLVLLQKVAPGALWIALLLSTLLSAERILQADFDDGSLEVMATGGLGLTAVAAVKAFAHWLTAGLPLAIVAPMMGFLINIAPGTVLPLTAAMILGSLTLSLLATFGAAVTVGLRRGGMLVALLVLPLNVPVLIFGVAASAPGGVPGAAQSSMALLAAAFLVSLVIVPVAAGAALRSHLR
ncbi:MAG TPA: heme exporter protein CcmB [Aestuariivirgaceae bacterium]|nr:heme exporter protein CcmB [Aestuariivirgaceae bacterium]